MRLHKIGLLSLVAPICFAAAAWPAHADTFFVRKGSSGGNGKSWAAAWANVSDIIWGGSGVTAGSTVCIAGGTGANYGALTIGTSGNSSARIYIKSATSQDSTHVCDGAAGWSSSYDAAANPPVLTQISAHSGNGSYVTVDGVIHYSGLQVHDASIGENYAVDLNAGGGPNSLELLNLNIYGDAETPDPGGASTCQFASQYTCFSGEGRAISALGGGDQMHIAYCHLHGKPTLMMSSGRTNMLFEHNTLDGNVVGNPSNDNSVAPQYQEGWHPNVWNTTGGDNNVTVRFNDISNYMVEGIMMSTSTADTGWYIYGNVWHGNPAFNVSRVLEAQYTTHGPVYLYNNTFINITHYIIGGANGTWAWNSASSSMNNLCYSASCGSIGFGSGHDDYNAVDTPNPAGAHSISGITSAAFDNFAGGKYDLAQKSKPVDAGTPLSTAVINSVSNSTDFAAHARGQGNGWDIGAYEFQASAAPNAPTGLHIQIQ